MEERGWQQPDFVLVTGDAYVDHHSFGTAIISRLLERYGYKVAILPQPDYKTAEDFRVFGKPRLGFLINSGVVDSMVNNYSVFRHKRKVDEYAPGGKAGRRPDRAVIVYANRAKEAYPDVPIIIGGLEASLRRLGHYDYWSDKVRRSILLDAKADLLIYGMGERAILEIAEALEAGIAARDITWVRGTCYRAKDLSLPGMEEAVRLPDFAQITADKRAYAESFAMQYRNHDAISAKMLTEKYSDTVYVVQNPPQPPLEREELDDLYELPFENAYHPSYAAAGGVPAFREVKFSLVSARGCFGGGGHFKRGKRAFLHHVGRVFRREAEHADANAAALEQDPRLRAGDGRTIRFPAHIGAEDRKGAGADAAVQKGWAAVKFMVAERHDVRFAADHGADEGQAGPIVRAEGIARIQQERSRRILRAQPCDLGGKGRKADILAGGADAAGEIGMAEQVEDDLSHGAHPFRPPRDTPVTMLLRQKMNSRIIGTTTMVEAAIRRS